MNKYYIREQLGRELTAVSKARDDVELFLKKRGYHQLTIHLHDLSKQSVFHKIGRHLQYLRDWIAIYRTVEKDSVLVIQHPLKLNALGKERLISALREKKNVKVAVLIHDLDSLRYQEERAEAQNADEMLNTLSDAIICHNHRMKEYLIGKGILEEKLHELELFDYQLPQIPTRAPQQKNSVIVAGNLDPEKSRYVYLLHEVAGVDFNLYGIRYDDTQKYDNIHYQGAFQPEELPSVLQGAFGLVWDGTSIDTCAGNTGNYLRYNNPHKLSLYMASGIPVIVWDQAAIAEFVKKYQVGLCVSSLKEIPAAIAELTEEAYEAMVRNAAEMAKKVSAGAFLNRAMDEVEAQTSKK